MTKPFIALLIAVLAVGCVHPGGEERLAAPGEPPAAEPTVRQQTPREPRGPAKPEPTYDNLAYGEHERNVLDFWKAESGSPTPLFIWYHGGGFRGGDKNSIPGEFLTPLLARGVSVAAVNYRLTGTAPHPAQMHDCARALQFLRAKSKDWNLDLARVAAAGSSAGSGIVQWLAYHDDLARPRAMNRVARQSTRLSCIVPINMQSTYDPRLIKEIVPGDAYKHPALPPLFGCPEGWDWDTDAISPELDAVLKDVGPITHLTADDPPVFMLSHARQETDGNIHHPNFSLHLKEALDKLGIENVRHLDTDFDSSEELYEEMRAFMLEHLGVKAQD